MKPFNSKFIKKVYSLTNYSRMIIPKQVNIGWFLEFCVTNENEEN